MNKESFKQLFHRPFVPYFFILLANYVVYFKTVTFRFTNFDDSALIVGNFSFIGHIGNLLRAFGQKVFADTGDMFYRPLLTVSFMLDALIGGTEPFIYHLTNTLIHVCASWLLFALLVELGHRRKLALVFALLFTVHPLTAQAVAWVPGRNDSLLAVFVLSAFLCLVRYAVAPTRGRYFGHLFFLGLALFTKETAVVAAPLAALYVCLFAREKGAALRALVPGWLLVLAAWAAARALVPGAVSGKSATEFMRAFIDGLPAAVPYLGKIVFPVDLSVLPVLADMTMKYGVLAAVFIAAVLVLARQRRMDYIVFGLAWFVLFLLISLAAPGRYYLEHRLYLPLIGIIITLAEALEFVRAVPKTRIVVPALALALIFVFSLMTYIHIDRFISSLVFWTSAAKSSPHSAFAHNGLGKEYLALNLLDPAEMEFKKALELDPRNIDVYVNIGVVRARKKRFYEADKIFAEALRVDPACYAAYVNYGQLCMDIGRESEAVAFWQKAITLNPREAGPYNRLIAYYRARGNEPEVARYEQALKNR